MCSGWLGSTLVYQALQGKCGDLFLLFLIYYWVINASEILIGFKLFPLFKRNCMRELYVAMRDSCFLLHRLEELGKGSKTASAVSGCRDEEDSRSFVALLG